jgi:hypothetical protein
MTERDDPYHRGSGWSDQTTVGHDTDAWREQTTPGITPVHGGPGAGATPTYPAGSGYGHDDGAAYGHGYAGPGAPPAGPPATAPDYSSRPVPFRRPDALAGLLLLLSGIAAGVSLLLRWVHGNDTTGWDLVHRAWNEARTDAGTIFRTGMWQPAAVVLGGAVLLVLGLLLFVPARTHRFLGALALLVSLVVGAGVLVPMSKAGWHVGRFDVGIWFAVAVGACGLLGALKALLTGPRSGTHPPRV